MRALTHLGTACCEQNPASFAMSIASVAAGYAAGVGIVHPLPSLRAQHGPYLFRADFDSSNLARIDYVGSHQLSDTFLPDHISTPDVFHAWLSSDPQSSYRVWFHFCVRGGRRSKTLHITLKNLNNKKPLIGEGMLPVIRTTSNPHWRRLPGGVEFITRKTEEGSAQSFIRPEGGEEEEGEGAEEDEGDEGAATETGAAGSSLSGASAAASPAASPTHSRQSSTSASTSAPAAAAAVGSKPAARKSSIGSKKAKIKHDTMELTLKYTFESDSATEETFFAFCLPYAYSTLQDQLLAYERKFAASTAAGKNVYFHRELLAHSLEGRRIDLLTISSHRGRSPSEFEPDREGLYPVPTAASSTRASKADMFWGARGDPNGAGAAASVSSSSSSSSTPAASASLCAPEARASRFATSKPIILLSSRVHPGETPSSFLLAGALDFLLDQRDPRAAAMREAFVIKVVPMLNPDGVVHGFYRTDSLGQNLNRFYEHPVPAIQPSIAAVRSLVAQWHSESPVRLFAYLDLHAHAMKRGLFIFGNEIENHALHLRNVGFAGLVALNSPYLSLSACNFSEKNMRARDSRDGLSKEGAGRVAFYKLTQCSHCYTVEVNYNSGRSVNVVQPLPEHPSAAASATGSTVAAASSSSPAAASSSSPSAPDLSWQREDYLLSQSSLLGPPVQYTEAHFKSMGKALMVALLDLMPPPAATAATTADSSVAAAAAAASAHVWSRLPSSEYVNLSGLDRWAARYLIQPPKRLVKKLSKTSGNKSATTATTKGAASAATATKASPDPSPRLKSATRS